MAALQWIAGQNHIVIVGGCGEIACLYEENHFWNHMQVSRARHRPLALQSRPDAGQQRVTQRMARLGQTYEVLVGWLQ